MEPDRHLLDSISTPITVLACDAQQVPRFIAANQACLVSAGLKRADLIGKTAQEAFPGPTGRSLYELHCFAFATGETICDELTLEINGRPRQVRTQLAPLLDDRGDVRQIVGTPVDLTAETQIQKLSQEASVLRKDLKEFVALAAHDLRSPMNKVAQIAQVLREEVPTDQHEAHRFVDMLEKLAGSAVSLIGELLTHAESERTRAVSSCRLRDLATHTMAMLDPARIHQLSVSDHVVLCDRMILEIALRNLLDNALKHNDCALHLTVTAEPTDRGCIEIIVADDGRGFGNARLPATGTQQSTGGFGLASVRQLLEARGGSLVIRPNGISGGLVAITLPGRVEPSVPDSAGRAT